MSQHSDPSGNLWHDDIGKLEKFQKFLIAFQQIKDWVWICLRQNSSTPLRTKLSLDYFFAIFRAGKESIIDTFKEIWTDLSILFLSFSCYLVSYAKPVKTRNWYFSKKRFSIIFWGTFFIGETFNCKVFLHKRGFQLNF